MMAQGELQSPDLPLADNGVDHRHPRNAPRAITWRIVPVVAVSLVLGGVIGLYFQPPGLQAFFRVAGLEPGGGTDTPLAIAIDQVTTQQEVAVVSEGDIVALGRILPNGDVINIATPFGAGDARLERLAVAVGDSVRAGDELAVLDNRQQFQLALDAAAANLRVQEAALMQTQSTVRASRNEARASLERAQATATQAMSELSRVTALLSRGATTQANLDQTEARADEAARDVERAQATLSRFEGLDQGIQVDVAVAQANLAAARVDVARAQSDLDRSVVRSPIDGVVLDITTRIGERPGEEGLMDLGDTSRMTVEAEVYQTLIGRVAIGDPVTVSAAAIDGELTGVVQAIGLEIGRQSITSDDPAANTDARVVDVIVGLDPESSEKAARLTNLQTVVRIDAGRTP